MADLFTRSSHTHITKSLEALQLGDSVREERDFQAMVAEVNLPRHADIFGEEGSEEGISLAKARELARSRHSNIVYWLRKRQKNSDRKVKKTLNKKLRTV